VVDFKTTQVKNEHRDFYGRQLSAYAYALEHPMPGQLKASPITHIGLLCFDPRKMQKTDGDGLGLLGPATWVEIPVDETAFLSFINDVLTLLSLPESPEPAEKCGYCAYRDASRVTGF
jgi:hypothetical protein